MNCRIMWNVVWMGFTAWCLVNLGVAKGSQDSGGMLKGAGASEVALPSDMPTAVPYQGLVESLPPVRTAEVRDTLERYCAKCHDGSSMQGSKRPKGGFGHILDMQRLARDVQYVVPGNPKGSELIRRMQLPLHDLDEERMPPASQQQPTEAEVRRIADWIEAGAPDEPIQTGESLLKLPYEKRSRFVSDQKIVDRIQADLETLPRVERGSVRYLSLVHYANDGSLTDDEVERFTQGLVKLVASLTWKPSTPGGPVYTKRLGPAGTLVRVHLAEMWGMSKAPWNGAKWDRLLEVGGQAADGSFTPYPYGIVYGTRTDRWVRAEMGTPVAFVRGDWFAFATTRPALYHELLELPSTDEELETYLGIDLAKAIGDGEVLRAGRLHGNSGVSRNNRLVERVEIPRQPLYPSGGYYWKSYDFIRSDGSRNLLNHPVGPKSLVGLAPDLREFAFDHDGGEIIWSLPNGLQAYMLVTEEGKAIAEGPPEIVFDKNSATEKRGVIVNPISCIGCHDLGMKPVVDEVLERAKKIHPPGILEELNLQYRGADYGGSQSAGRESRGKQDREGYDKGLAAIAQVIATDRACFQDSVTRIGSYTGTAGLGQEAIVALSKRFQSEPLRLASAAAEVGLRPEALLDQLGGGLLPIKEALRPDSGQGIARGQWVQAYQRIITDLRLGAVYLPSPAIPQPLVSDSPRRQLRATDSLRIGFQEVNRRALPDLSWARVLQAAPTIEEIPDGEHRSEIQSTGLPWKVEDRRSGIVFLLVPPGEFQMGSPEQEPGRARDEVVHAVQIRSPFYLGQTEVTQGQWLHVASLGLGGVAGIRSLGFLATDLPAEGMTWEEASLFCAALGGQLPTEAQWEYACRSGQTTPFSLGKSGGMSQAAPIGNFRDSTVRGLRVRGKDSRRSTRVASFVQNPWGFHDMHGNVAEWCRDWYGEYSGLGLADPAGPFAGEARVVRGGHGFDPAQNCRSARRHSQSPVVRTPRVGFRMVRRP